jgi:hypothetical protein
MTWPLVPSPVHGHIAVQRFKDPNLLKHGQVSHGGVKYLPKTAGATRRTISREGETSKVRVYCMVRNPSSCLEYF